MNASHLTLQVAITAGKSLVERCLANERSAQKELYDQYKNGMFTVAYRITANADAAADALQEGFLDVFRCLHNFKGQSTLGSWIKTIIVRHAIKQKKMQFVYESFNPNEHDDAAEECNKLESWYLEKIILALPDGYRSVFTLIEIEGYSHKECADILGISENTSRSQLFHAKKMLKLKIKGK